MRKFYLETYGCKLNQADSGFIRAILLEEFEQAFEPEEADFFVLNSCAVLERTERKIAKRIKFLKEKKKKIIVTGCLPTVSREACQLADGLLTPQNIVLLAQAARRILEGKKTILLQRATWDRSDRKGFCIFERPGDNYSTIISISQGCLGSCSFCAARLARGRLKSLEPEIVLERIKRALALGYKEIQLTGQDLSCYGWDKKDFHGLANLLSRIASLKGEFRVKLGMLEPYLLKRILKDLTPVLKDERFYKFFHIPLQSGDNAVLKAMQRKYQRKDFLSVVSSLEKNFSDYLLAIDVIVGFPGENEKAFENTLKVIEGMRPQIVNINRFSSRPGTRASLFKDLADRIKKERSRKLDRLCQQIKLQKNQEYLHKEFKVLVARKGKGNTYLSRNQIGKAIVLPKAKPGTFTRAKVIDFRPSFLIGIAFGGLGAFHSKEKHSLISFQDHIKLYNSCPKAPRLRPRG